MRIAIVAPSFLPAIGGIESVCYLLAKELAQLGEVVVVCVPTAAEQQSDHQFAFTVVRQPSPAQVFRVFSESHAVIIMQGTCSVGWPWLFYRQRCVVSYHIWSTWGNRSSLVSYLCGRAMRRFLPTTACSEYLARTISPSCSYMPNPYDATTFRLKNYGPRCVDVAFVGRMIAWKGVDILIRALSELRAIGKSLNCVFVGSGPDELQFKELARQLNVSQMIDWRGALSAERVSAVLNSAKVLCVPSTWDEPFGLVALEGMACGCRVVASNAGGLAEAVGAAGTLIPKHDVAGLAHALSSEVDSWRSTDRVPPIVEAHLKMHHPSEVAAQYLGLFLGAPQRPVAKVPSN